MIMIMIMIMMILTIIMIGIYFDDDDFEDYFDEDLHGLRSQPSLSQTPSYLSSPNPQGVPSHLRIVIIIMFIIAVVVVIVVIIFVVIVVVIVVAVVVSLVNVFIHVTESPFRTIGVTGMRCVRSGHAVRLSDDNHYQLIMIMIIITES